MRIEIVCGKCSEEASGIAQCFVEKISDNGFYDVRCPKGHEALVLTQTLRHEMLFEIALNAIVDGYYREAIASFAASAERFFEFAIRVICRKHQTHADLLANIWKSVASSSERQFGAFVFLYSATFGAAPTTYENSLVSIRNKVVHKGQIPRAAEAERFGEATFRIIQISLSELRRKCCPELNAELADHMARIAVLAGTRYPRTCSTSPTVLNATKDIPTPLPTFATLLAQFLDKKHPI